MRFRLFCRLTPEMLSTITLPVSPTTVYLAPALPQRGHLWSASKRSNACSWRQTERRPSLRCCCRSARLASGRNSSSSRPAMNSPVTRPSRASRRSAAFSGRRSAAARKRTLPLYSRMCSVSAVASTLAGPSEHFSHAATSMSCAQRAAPASAQAASQASGPTALTSAASAEFPLPGLAAASAGAAAAAPPAAAAEALAASAAPPVRAPATAARQRASSARHREATS
mmetsp:Transcript_81877/g.252921  ORF Transcript_81877/g.252921 Transcript_81877/m.252921 type:complete len:227 (-) Transcript_81877:107-787(-)